MGLLRSFDRCGKMRSRCETGEDPACICTRLERSWPTQTFGPSAGMAAKRTLATIHAANCIIGLAAVAAIAFVPKISTDGTVRHVADTPPDLLRAYFVRLAARFFRYQPVTNSKKASGVDCGQTSAAVHPSSLNRSAINGEKASSDARFRSSP